MSAPPAAPPPAAPPPNRGPAVDLARLLPRSVAGYSADGPDGRYTADTLFELINGSAEVYRALNVQQVLSRRYAATGHPDVLVDLFAMATSADAFGAYHHDIREGSSAGCGAESEYMGGSLYFWKGRVFGSVVALGETPASKAAVLAMGRAAAAEIKGSSPPPAVLSLLPVAGRQPGQVAYFRGWEHLNTRYFLADRNLLQLDETTEGVLAPYASTPPGGAPALVIVVRYPSAARAARAHRSFVTRYLPDADSAGLARTEDGRWAGAGTRDSVVACVLDSPSRADALQRLVQVWAAHAASTSPPGPRSSP